MSWFMDWVINVGEDRDVDVDIKFAVLCYAVLCN